MESASERVTRVAAYVVALDDAGRLLLTRLNERTTRPGAWTLPGGGLEFGEHPEVAALRELEEETGYAGRLNRLLTVDAYHAPAGTPFEFEFHAIRIVYGCTILGGELRHEADGNSSDQAAWWTRKELMTLPLVSLAAVGVELAFGFREPGLANQSENHGGT